MDEEAVHEPPAAGDGVIGRLQRICRDAARVLSASGVGMSVMAGDGVHGMATASDPATGRIEELQFTFGEGPCVDALATGWPVLVPDLTDGAAGRWPIYAPAVHDAGVRAVFAFPLRIGAARLGVLDVFRTLPGPLSQEELGRALIFADRAVTALLDGQEHATTARDGPDGLGEAIGHRAELFQAQGMVMVQLRVPPAEALARIRAYAYAGTRPLHVVVADVVARRLRFDRDRPEVLPPAR